MQRTNAPPRAPSAVTLFLCGDVMTGRGVDQILPHPGDGRIDEEFVRHAAGYVALAERRCGEIPRGRGFDYVWGDALDELSRVAPAARVINLETSVTRSDTPWPNKSIHYRMHPDNLPCLGAAGVDVCALANNHLLDYGPAGLVETLDILRRAGIKTAGAGRTLDDALRPAEVELAPGGRLLVFSLGTQDSGVLPRQAAGLDRPGVALLRDFSNAAADEVAARVTREKRAGDVAVASIHWGSNWGYAVPDDHVRFAHRLIDGGVDVVHGHSSHHPRPVEVYRGRLVLYGCGDLVNDYEGIDGYEEFRADLRLLYFATVDLTTGALVALRMTPMRARAMRLQRATPDEARWLSEALDEASRLFGSRIEQDDDGSLALRWAHAPRA